MFDFARALSTCYVHVSTNCPAKSVTAYGFATIKNIVILSVRASYLYVRIWRLQTSDSDV